MSERCLFSTGGLVGVLLILAALVRAVFARKHERSS